MIQFMFIITVLLVLQIHASEPTKAYYPPENTVVKCQYNFIEIKAGVEYYYSKQLYGTLDFYTNDGRFIFYMVNFSKEMAKMPHIDTSINWIQQEVQDVYCEKRYKKLAK